MHTCNLCDRGRGLRQENHEFETNQGCIGDPVLKQNENENSCNERTRTIVVYSLDLQRQIITQS